MTYPVQFRKKVLKIKEEEQISFVEVAERFNLSKTTVFAWSKKLEPNKHRNRKTTKIDMDALKQDIENHPDSYSYERAQRFGVSPSGIRYAKQRLGITYKKNSQSSKGGSRKKIYVLSRD